MTESSERTRIQLIVFNLDQHEFAVPIEQVWRVESLADQTPTRVPRAPAFLEGVVNVRGQVVPMVDLKKRLGFPTSSRPPKSRLLVVEMEGQRVGLIVDGVSDIMWVATARIEPPPSMVAQISGVFVQGVAKEENDRLLIILDLREALTPGERQELRAVEEKGASASKRRSRSPGPARPGFAERTEVPQGQASSAAPQER
jgi:purine-binding chemotaxis protein CheW